MPTLVTNPSVEPTTLPFPYQGVLKGKQSVLFAAAPSVVIANLRGVVASAALVITEVPNSTGPFDDATYGVVALSLSTPVVMANLAHPGGTATFTFPTPLTNTNYAVAMSVNTNTLPNWSNKTTTGIDVDSGVGCILDLVIFPVP